MPRAIGNSRLMRDIRAIVVVVVVVVVCACVCQGRGDDENRELG